MSWPPAADQFVDLVAALTAVERVVGQAFARAAERHSWALGPQKVQVVRQEFRPDTGTWWVYWWLDLPDGAAPYDEVRCDLDLSSGSPVAEMCGFIAIRRYLGRGETAEDDLWRSAPYQVASSAAAVAAARGVAADLVKQLRRLDLKPYLQKRPIEPDPGADRGRESL